MRRGATMLEALLWLGLIGLVLGGATALWAATGRGARLTLDHDSAQIAACQVVEAIRRDAERMLFVDPREHLWISPDGRQLTVGRVLANGDPWVMSGERVLFSAVKAGRRGRVLVRQTAARREVLRTPPLADVRFRYQPRPGARSRLSVVVVAMPSEVSAVRAVATAAISLPSFDPYHHYVLSFKEK